MKTQKKHLLPILVGLALAQSASAAVIFSDDFSVDGALNGTTTDVGSGTWVAKTGITVSGGQVLNNGSSTSFLAWTPSAGNIYTLSADLITSTPSATTSYFSGIGFFNNKSTVAILRDSSFNGGGGADAPTTPWAFVRTSNTAASLGDSSLRPFGGSTSEQALNTSFTIPSTLNLKLVLNTNDTDLVTAGDQFSISYFVNDVQYGVAHTYSAAQSTTLLSAIANVGFTVNTRASGDTVRFDNFSLSDATAVPEPSTFAALAGLGALGFAATRRRRA